MPSSRALCGSVYRAQTLTGLIGLRRADVSEFYLYPRPYSLPLLTWNTAA
jgi:hypothetical protein